jgi:hypothetical protein
LLLQVKFVGEWHAMEGPLIYPIIFRILTLSRKVSIIDYLLIRQKNS